ncbi:hypothetical protein [Aureimonas sp. AU40]|uniref:hypothetical protein n=1 Tax=Aureimonas sp. AU40 TaxID=1637747 RepID=UPI0007821D3C|nr:hypothetical protein [Aureimonas sp. AU40]
MSTPLARHLDAILEIVASSGQAELSDQLADYRSRGELYDDFLTDLANLINASSAEWDESMRGDPH